jgi:hypothetical protein
MKKILSLVLILLIVWIVSLLYAAHQTEKLITQYIVKTNEFYRQNYLGIELELTKFESNFFDANAQYTIKINSKELSKVLNLNKDEFVKFETVVKDPFIVNQNIQYGPILFGGDNVEFGMAKISYHSTLNNLIRAVIPYISSEEQLNTKKLNGIISDLSQVLEKEVTLNFTSVLSFFSNEIYSSGSISDIRINKNGISLMVEEMTFDSVNSVQNPLLNSRLNVPNIVFKSKEGEIINIQNLLIFHNFDKATDELNYLGNTKFGIQNLSFQFSADEKINLAVNSVMDLSQGKEPNLVNAKFGAKLEILKYLKKAELTPFDLPKILQFSLSLNGFNQAEFATIFYKIRDCVATTDIEKTNPLVCLKSNIDNIEKIFVKQVSNLNFNVDVTTIRQPKIHNTGNINVVYNFDKGDIKQLLTIINDHPAEVGKFVRGKFIANLKVKANPEILKDSEPALKMLMQKNLIVKKSGLYQADISYQKEKFTADGKDVTAIFQQLGMSNK